MRQISDAAADHVARGGAGQAYGAADQVADTSLHRAREFLR
jgi:hypothetical protein